MKYYGSKRRLANFILPIILKDRVDDSQYYVEPFCGGCNLIDKVSGNRIANDVNRPLIGLLRAVSEGWTPPEYITKEMYNGVWDLYRSGRDLDNPLMGWVAFCCSFCGRFWGCYAGDKNDTPTKKRYQEDAKKNLARQAPNLKGIGFNSLPYNELIIPSNSIIYCDPPYQGTDRYKTSLDYGKFWQWCRDKTKEGHKVFISEYQAPDDFECVFSMESVNTIGFAEETRKGKKKTHKSLEKLFIYAGNQSKC